MSRASSYLSKDTIAAIATALGGAVVIIRVSGPGAFALLSKLAPGSPSGVLSLQKPRPRTLYRASICEPDSGISIDDALVVRFVGPESFTGEDCVEFHLHGGSFIAPRLLEVLIKQGARQALPGEFSFRAVRNGKMSIVQAQAVADLINAGSDQAVSLALEKMEGSQNKIFAQLAEDLRKVAMLSEAGIDFSDQDIEEVSIPALKKRIAPVLLVLEKLKAGFERGVRIQEGIRTVILGLPNAGKSSLFNTILGEDRAIVSPLAGTTRDVIREQFTIKGKQGRVTLLLEDTAGLRSSTDLIEQNGIRRTMAASARAELVLLIADCTEAIEPVLEQWRILGAPVNKTIGILTKSDLLRSENSNELTKELYKKLGIQEWVVTSAVTGEGIQSAAEKISEFCGRLLERKPGEMLLTRLEQLRLVEKAEEHLLRAETVVEADLFAADIRQALVTLGPLIGETLPDDILGEIFSNFCIGK